MSNRKQARDNLMESVRLVVQGLEYIGIPALKARDKREPGRREKMRFEDLLMTVIVRHFGRQQRKIREQLREAYPDRKSIKIMDDIYDDERFIAELMLLLQDASRDGVALFGRLSPTQIDWTLTNQRAAEWAREYTYTLVRDIDKTTRALLQTAIEQFVSTPGMTLRDVMRLLPYDEDRAQRIAVTEITRVYARSGQIAGEDLQREFPDVKVVKIWYTNADDLVCTSVCLPLDGKEVPINENFYPPNPPYADGNPPAHVNCRCWTTTTTKIVELD